MIYEPDSYSDYRPRSWIIAFPLLAPLSHIMRDSLLYIEVFLSDSVGFTIGRSSTVAY
jgi:hypothetical protein